MNNLAYKKTYEQLNEQFGSSEALIQSFAFNNSADIVKTIDYFKEISHDAKNERLEWAKQNITRLENLLVLRIAITEDLYTEPTDFYKSEEEEEKDRTIQKKDVKDTKVIEHPESKKVKTRNEKLGEKTNAKKDSKKDKKDKEGVDHSLSTFEKMNKTKELQEERISTYYDKVENAIQHNDRDLARKYIKIAFMCYGKGIPHITDPEVEKMIDWLMGDVFNNWTMLEWLEKRNSVSISEIVKDAESKVKQNGLGADEVKDLYKPYFFGKLKEEPMNVKSDEEYEKKFNQTLSFLFDKDHKVDNAPKEAPKREELVQNFYEQHKEIEDLSKRIAKTTNDVRSQLKKMGADRTIKSIYGEVLSYLKSNDEESYNKYMEAKKAKEGKSNEESTDEDNKTKEVKTEKVETEEKAPSVPNIDLSNFKTQISRLKKLKDINEYIITLINKAVKPLSELSDEERENALLEIAKDRILTLDEEEISDWTESDVAQHLAQNVFPYTKGEYEILKAQNEEEFIQAYKYFVEKYPEGKEKERIAKVTDIMSTDIPKSKFSKSLGKSLRKNTNYALNILRDSYKKIIEETK